MIPKAKLSVKAGAKIALVKKREFEAIAIDDGANVSNLFTSVISHDVAPAGNGGRKRINNRLIELMIRNDVELCPVLRNLRAIDELGDARPT